MSVSSDKTREEVDELIITQDSVFKLPIRNTLGLDALKSKSLLKSFALQNPVDYTKMRSKAYDTIVSGLVESNYEIIWNLLKNGQDEKGRTIISLDGTEWSPNLPDQEISKIAGGYAESILNLFDDIFEKILPSDYKSMADDKLTDLAKLKLMTTTA